MPWLLSKLLPLQRASSGGACSGTSPRLSLLLPPEGQPLGMAERQCWDHQFSPLVRVHASLAAAVPEEGYLSCCESRSCSSLQTKASSIYFSWELVHGVTCFALPQPVVCAEAAGTQNPVPSGEGSSPCSHSKYSHAHTKQSLGNSLASRTAEQTG